EVDRLKQEVLRIRYEEQAKRETRRVAQTPVAGRPAGGLSPWRHVIKPHPDVYTGRYTAAEFAADLAQVHRGEGSDEYRDPVEFFRRTYMTEGIKALLIDAARRLSGEGGDPVIELQTNFGGGKTHSLLALYHLFSGAPVDKMAGVPELMREKGVRLPDKVRRAVIVGTAIPPGQPQTKPDGTVVRTLWGEIAWQLGGKEGFSMVAQADATSTNPGSALVDLFRTYAPCMILIDEWVAYARQLYTNNELPAGTFDTHFTFAQALTEAAAAVPGTLLVISIPASDAANGSQGTSVAEIGGEGGAEALRRLKNVIGRLQSPWRPASAKESFEIVRRRLFEPVTDPELLVARDAVVQSYADLYASQREEFPSECREGMYRERIKAAYPIHPELFERLYSDWSSLEKFQRTRGVLRLMAAVIHALWVREDASLLIMPGTVPIDDEIVLNELTRYLEDNWKPIIEKDVDGPASVPVMIDRENPNLGRYSATRRVARTIYLGSAPTVGTKHPGLEDKRIKLGCVQPGEPPAVFGDALRRLSDKATHLTTDGSRYAYTVKPTLTRLALDRADGLKEADVDAEIVKLLRSAATARGEFCGVHVAPESPSVVADEAEVRLVILGPQDPHWPKSEDSDARVHAAEILASRGTSPRRFRNMVVFLAPDRSTLELVRSAVRSKLAWESIARDEDALDLGASQSAQVEAKVRDASETARQRLGETWQWAIVPTQPDPNGEVEWRPIKVGGDGQLAVRVSQKLVSEEQIITRTAGTVLRLWLDRIPLWKGDAINIRELWHLFAQYLYLPRLKDINVLLAAVQDGVSSLNWRSETFGYAEAFDEKTGTYRGVHAGEAVSVMASGYILKPSLAEALTAKIAQEGAGLEVGAEQTLLWAPEGTRPYDGETAPTGPAGTAADLPKRFHGTVELDPLAPAGEVGKIAQEVLAHLSALPGARLRVELDIQADVPGGVPDHVQRTVSENAAVLKFREYGFEKE
ncbi:MAG: DUF499 domain-containing protein, partial [Actinomycetia bacterium]|nr:DUF499 domain-containing protein [Actinomycetes bacterium]